MTPSITLSAPEGTPFARVKHGDTVVVYSKGGVKDRFVVKTVDAEHIVSERGTKYHKSQVTKLERKAFSWPKTCGLAAGVFLGVVALRIPGRSTILTGCLSCSTTGVARSPASTGIAACAASTAATFAVSRARAASETCAG